MGASPVLERPGDERLRKVAPTKIVSPPLRQKWPISAFPRAAQVTGCNTKGPVTASRLPLPVPTEPPTEPPATLEYFAPRDPERRRAAGVVTWSVILLLSWAPYLCGVVNASTVARSYVPSITAAHVHGTVIGFAIGVVMSSASLVWFARRRIWPGVIAAGVVVMVQASVAICLGLAS